MLVVMRRPSWWMLAGVLTVGCTGAEDEPVPRLEIIIDDRGVPHVFGVTDDDAFYGAGYQMASDRLFQMEMMRRRAQGRAAEVLGQRAVEDDELARIFDWPGWARQHAAAMMAENTDTYAVLEAWSRGVNARIAEIADGTVPRPWGFRAEQFDFAPEPWTPVDILTIATMTGFGNDLSFDREVFATIAYKLAADALAAVQLLKPIRPVYTMGPLSGASAPHEDTSAAPFAPAAELDELALAQLADTIRGLRRVQRLRGLGSNNWAVAGEHTANGRPLIAGDPHQNFDPPGIFYAQHINSKAQGGTIDAAGFSFVGTPGISVGQTDRTMWTPTTAFADVMDVWTVAVPDPDHIMLGGNAVAVAHRQEVIAIRGEGKPIGEGTTRALDLVDVPGHGVLLPVDLVPLPLGDPGDRLLMSWTGFRPSSFAGLLDFNRAQDIDEFDRAVLGWSGNFNFVAADSGGITYRVGTKVPVRDLGGGRRPDLVLDGDDPASLWTDARLPAEQLPHSRGEGRGFLVTANNDPFGFVADGRIDDDPWYFGAYFDPGWRAGRIESELYRLTAAGGLGIADMQALQNDVHSSLADDLLPLLAAAHGRIATDPALAEFAGRSDLDTLAGALAGWDRAERHDSGVSLVMHAYGYFVTRRTLEDDLPLLFLQALELQPSFIVKLATMALRGDYPDGDVVLQEGRDWIMLAALGDTADLLMARYGTVDPGAYQLGDMRFSDLDGATGTGIDRGLHPTDGGMSSPNVVADATFFDAQGGVVMQSTSPHGPIFRITGEFDGDTPVLHFNFPLGNVADPDSPHFEDFQADWLAGRSRTMLFDRADIEAAAEHSYRLLEDE